jgi:hypothetical protein
MRSKIEILIPFFLLGIFLGFLLFFVQQCNSEPKVEIKYIEKTKYYYDTTIIDGIAPPPIIIKKNIPIVRIDTVYLDKKDIIINPFSVCIDTVEQKDTLRVCYSYPEQNFSVVLKKTPPIIKVITITKDNYIESSDWSKVLYFVAGASTMYVSQQIAK